MALSRLRLESVARYLRDSGYAGSWCWCPRARANHSSVQTAQSFLRMMSSNSTGASSCGRRTRLGSRGRPPHAALFCGDVVGRGGVEDLAAAVGVGDVDVEPLAAHVGVVRLRIVHQ